jgi:hypothetical protein
VFGPGFTPIEVGGPTNPVGVVVTIIEFLATLLGIGGNSTAVLTRAINTTWTNLVFTTAFLYNAIGFLTDFIKKLLGIIVGGIAHIITDILHGHLKKVLEDIQALLHALHNLFAPLIAWLRKLQAIQRQYQLQTMRRIVNLIQRARQILVVFRLLHLKFAQKLDAWLAGIEGKIITREMDIARKTNEILGWVDFVTDPFGALRGTAVFGPIGTLLRSLAAAARAADLDKVFPQLARHPGGTTAGIPWHQYAADTHVQAATGTGHYAIVHESASTTLARLNSELST